MFQLVTNFKPQGDQKQAIEKLVKGVQQGQKNQVLLGATGTGKTFTMANVIQQTQKPTLILAPNKTLVLQIYQEMVNFFPHNKVEYYVSYFDYYQPEAYKPSSNTYISKKAQVNKEIQKMRLKTLNSLVTNEKVIVVASVAAIYGCFDPRSYRQAVLKLSVEQKVSLKEVAVWLIKQGYNAQALELEEGSFLVERESIILKIIWETEHYWKLTIKNDIIKQIERHEVKDQSKKENQESILIPPTREYVYPEEENRSLAKILGEMRQELKERINQLNQAGKTIEAKRLEKKTGEDLANLGATGICPMIENYSRYFDGRKEGECPYALLDYFPSDYLTIIDESHLAIPQIQAMYNTDRSRKKTLVEYGFRLPSALDNRPLNFTEFINKLTYVIYTSATPGPYEMKQTNYQAVEQIIRPTGLLDPQIEVRPTRNQIEDIVQLIRQQIIKKEKTIIYALTIKMAESITHYLNNDKDIKSIYLHSKLDIFDRNQNINSLRRGTYDVIVGINLLREGLDMPEVSLICILDADKPGFLRDTRSLIQIIGRVARHKNGRVILYGDTITANMREAMAETERRRSIQATHNQKNEIIPQTVQKEIFFLDPRLTALRKAKKEQKWNQQKLSKEIRFLKRQMKKAVQEFNFDKAAEYRDLILDLQNVEE